MSRLPVTRITTVVTPAATRNLASRELFKMGPKTLDGSQDEYIDRLNASKSGLFENLCNRVFARETLRDVFRLHTGYGNFYGGLHGAEYGVNPLILSRRPVTGITSVIDRSGTLDPTLYEVAPETGFLTRLHARGDGTFIPVGWSGPTVTVTFTAGYLLPEDQGRDLPYEIEEAVIALMRGAFKGKDRDPALRSQSDGGIGNQSFWLGIPPDVQSVIDSYRDVTLGV